ncbi:MAG TPA: response regulator [Thermoanaerobaculia bacterium]|nr:response regulator [Thermoanaerobaculia bacterium]
MAKILLVEDSARDVEITLANLRNSGVDASIQVVRDGEQALDYLDRRKELALRSEERPDVLLLDIKMPKVSGLQVLRAMKSDPDSAQHPSRSPDVVARRTGSCRCLSMERGEIPDQAGPAGKTRSNDRCRDGWGDLSFALRRTRAMPGAAATSG